MASPNPISWPGRILSGAVGLLLAALALRWAVQIIESIWPTLVIIAVAIGSLIIVSFVVRLLWRRHDLDRW